MKRRYPRSIKKLFQGRGLHRITPSSDRRVMRVIRWMYRHGLIPDSILLAAKGEE